ncbi:hypothetical protein NDU88_002631 [Pleurodeles waltl]|uniref:Uncharacterized protein n=1 Tax=Pleurodeles waltl TaxID=8319 RepID=A0AAV7Q7J1_PLEWA|nr:hypothetical protein NDU88_002631 [Pleurodeles waltl]
MAKIEGKQGTLQFDTRCTVSQQMALMTWSQQPTTTEPMLDRKHLLLDMKHNFHTIGSKIDTLRGKLDRMNKHMIAHGEHLGQLKQCTLQTEDTTKAQQLKLLLMEKVLAIIQAKNEDLEASSHRNKLSILGAEQTAPR